MGCKENLAMCCSLACLCFLANQAVTREMKTDDQVIETEQHQNNEYSGRRLLDKVKKKDALRPRLALVFPYQ